MDGFLEKTAEIVAVLSIPAALATALALSFSLGLWCHWAPRAIHRPPNTSRLRKWGGFFCEWEVERDRRHQDGPSLSSGPKAGPLIFVRTNRPLGMAGTTGLVDGVSTGGI